MWWCAVLCRCWKQDWPGGWYSWNESSALEIHDPGAELDIVNSDLLSTYTDVSPLWWAHSPAPGQTLVNITAGHLNLKQVWCVQ
jgi:hypothetical protein